MSGLSAKASGVHRVWRSEPCYADWNALVGHSEPIERIRALGRQICTRTRRGATPTILLTGETGTGKGLVAKCFHAGGGRSEQPFIDVNCAAIPASLIESELFGHERGAFTDAREGRIGLIEAADGGTLFLDEVALLPVDLQAKLLTAIEEKRVRRIGSRTPVDVNIQFIAATHRDLARMVEHNEFRADLYHRLNVIALRMPPLRDRGEDKLILAQRFLEQMCKDFNIPPRQLSPGACERIASHPWPGNVRQLRNKLERILMLENSDVIQGDDFDSLDGTPSVRVTCNDQNLTVRLPPQGVRLDRLEAEVIRATLAACDGNVSRAARSLGITRQTLIYRMKKHGLDARKAT
jgi:two-component system, NtrC family, response regulator AtoC